MKTCKINKKFLAYFFIWLFFVLINLDLSLGSYGESEPKAGNIFLVITLIVVAIGIGIFFKKKPKILEVKNS